MKKSYMIFVLFIVNLVAVNYGATIQTTFTDDEALSAVYSPSNGTYNYTVESTNFWKKGYWTNWTVFVESIVDGSSPVITNWITSTTNQYVEGYQVTQDVFRITTHYTAAEVLSRILTSWVYDGGTTYAMRVNIPIADLTNAITASGTYVLKTGDTMSGDLNMASNDVREIGGLYFTDGSSIVTGGSLHVTGNIKTFGSITIATNVDERTVFLAWQEDPNGSITTQALVTTTNGYTMAAGLSWTNLTGTVTNSLAGTWADISVFLIKNIGAQDYSGFKSSNNFYHIVSGSAVDQTLVNCASNTTITTKAGTYVGAGQFYGSAALTVITTTNTPFVVSTNSTYTVVTNTIHSTSNQFYWVFDGTTNQFGDSATATNLAYIAAIAHDAVVSNAVIVDAAARDVISTNLAVVNAAARDIAATNAAVINAAARDVVMSNAVIVDAAARDVISTNLAIINAAARDVVMSNAVIVDAAARDVAATNDVVDWVVAQGYSDASGLDYYLIGSTTNADSTPTYYSMSKTPGGTAVSTQLFSNVTNNQYLSQYITPTNQPNLSVLKSGLYNVHFHARKVGVPGAIKLKAEIYIYHSDGVITQEIEETSVSDYIGTIQTSYDLYVPVVIDTTITTADRIVVKIKAQNVTSTPDIEIYTEGSAVAHITLPINSGNYALTTEFEGGTNTVVDWVLEQNYGAGDGVTNNFTTVIVSNIITDTIIVSNIVADSMTITNITVTGTFKIKNSTFHFNDNVISNEVGGVWYDFVNTTNKITSGGGGSSLPGGYDAYLGTDYNDLRSALDAGAESIFVPGGSYSNVAGTWATSFAPSAGQTFNIVGESKETSIVYIKPTVAWAWKSNYGYTTTFQNCTIIMDSGYDGHTYFGYANKGVATKFTFNDCNVIAEVDNSAGDSCILFQEGADGGTGKIDARFYRCNIDLSSTSSVLLYNTNGGRARNPVLEIVDCEVSMSTTDASGYFQIARLYYTCGSTTKILVDRSTFTCSGSTTKFIPFVIDGVDGFAFEKLHIINSAFNGTLGYGLLDTGAYINDLLISGNTVNFATGTDSLIHFTGQANWSRTRIVNNKFNTGNLFLECETVGTNAGIIYCKGNDITAATLTNSSGAVTLGWDNIER